MDWDNPRHGGTVKIGVTKLPTKKPGVSHNLTAALSPRFSTGRRGVVAPLGMTIDALRLRLTEMRQDVFFALALCPRLSTYDVANSGHLSELDTGIRVAAGVSSLHRHRRGGGSGLI